MAIAALLLALAIADPAVALSAIGDAPSDRVALDVPYLPQTEALCGGAAAAMVFRYWGDQHAGVQEFASIVDRRAGGIASNVLVQAVEERGFRTAVLPGSVDVIRAQLASGHPLILLLEVRPNRYHYFVAVGADADRVWLHDPTWGPSRPYPINELERRWKATNFWTLLVLPSDASLSAGSQKVEAGRGPAEPVALPDTPCDRALAEAIDEIRTHGLDVADVPLSSLRRECPDQSEPISELAGVRFAQRRFDEAAVLAQEATERDVHDLYAWDVLGSSRFVQNDLDGALAAWNRLDKPQLDSIRIQGLSRTRYALVAQMLGLTPDTLLAEAGYRRAERRLGLLPDQLTARIGYRPQADGFAIIDVAVSERPRAPSGLAAWAGAAAHAVAVREIEAVLPGWSGQGEVWTASWRWWEERPRAALAFTAPRAGTWPGVWRVDGFQEAQTYDLSDRDSRFRETRTHVGVGVTDWLGSQVRYELRAGVDAWDPGHKALSIGATLERRWFDDRIAVSGAFENWMLPWPEPHQAVPELSVPSDRSGFRAATLHAALRSMSHGVVHLVDARAEAVSGSAPLSLWPGAGDGHARTTLLRAHPLLHDGVIEGPAFGRQLLALSFESQRWLERPTIARVGLAVFADMVKAGARVPGVPGGSAQVDAGIGLRVRVPGQDGALRLDYARGLRDGHQAITVGWSVDR